MIKNYLKIAIRHLIRHKSYTFINTIGLGVSLAACIIIGLWINYELSYDDYHKNSDYIYRIVIDDFAATAPTIAPALQTDYPELTENLVRFWPIKAPSDIVYKDQVYAERNITFTDPTVFDVFTHPLVMGNKETALSSPKSIAISESMAKKYFKDDNPMGKSLNMWGQDLTVTAVFKDVPLNSHHRFDLLVPMKLLKTFVGNMMENWSWAGFYTYALLPKNVEPQKVNTAIGSLFEKYTNDPAPVSRLQPLNDIYFGSVEKDIAKTGNFTYVIVLGTIAIFVLVVACINFMNLSAAYSTLRQTEVGMRKTLGAQRKQLVGQFLGEAIIMSFLALIVALFVVEMSLPFFSNFTGNPLQIPYHHTFLLIVGFIGLALLVGGVAGSYPAFILSTFKPIHAFKGDSGSLASSTGFLRKGLVVFQFIISTFLIVAAITVFTQLDFMQNKNLGFDDSQIIITEAGDYQLLKQELSKIPGIESISASQSVPGERFPFYPFRTPNMAPDSMPTMRTLQVNPGFIKTLGIKMAMGRSFEEDIPTDETSAFVINQAAAKYIGWDDPIGKELSWYDFSEDGTTFEVAKQGKVIGVVDDFNYASLHNPVEPLLMHVTKNINVAVLRLKPGLTGQTISKIRETWNAVSPDRPFWYYFLDQELDRQYGSEQKLGQVFGGLTLLALFIACLGLFGLTTFTAQRRTKEIGIRKVLGASVANIVTLLSKDFVKLVLIGFVIAIPIAWYAMSRWLADFAYKIDLGFGIFALAGAASLLIALLTVSWQSIKAALTNPVESLKSE